MSKVIKIKLEERPEFADDDDIVTFIYDALSSWGGQLPPDHPMFDSLSMEYIKIGGTQYTIAEDDDD